VLKINLKENENESNNRNAGEAKRLPALRGMEAKE
jgi:hypothetical protein